MLTPPAVVKGVVYAVAGPTVVALAAATGATVWTRRVPCTPVGTPAVAAFVDVGCTDGSVVSLALATGTVRWRYKQPDTQTMQQSISLVGTTVIAATDAGRVFAVSGAGTLVWSTPLAPVQSFASYDGVVYVSTDSASTYTVTALSATGGNRRRIP